MKLSNLIASIAFIFTINTTIFSQVFTEIEVASANLSNMGAVRIGDVNGDGHLDIIAADKTKDDLYWFKNDGDAEPTFTTIQITPNAGEIATLRIIDLDGGTNKDILASSKGHNNITWYRSSGGLNPTFQKKTIITPLSYAWGVDAGDLDGDNIVDVAGTSRDSDQVWWWKNSGGANPTWSGTMIEDNLNGTYNLVIADINGDTDLDIAVTSKFSDEVIWYENDGNANPSFTKHIIDNGTANNPNDLIAVDIDADGDMDLFAAIDLSQVAFYENDGNDPPTFTKNTFAYNNVTSLAVADINDDTHKDIIATGQTLNFKVYHNDGNTPVGFSENTYPLTTYGNTVGAGDLDGDGDADLSIASYSNSKVNWVEQQIATEIEVKGNSTNITDGSTSALPANDTDFGDVEIGTSHT